MLSASCILLCVAGVLSYPETFTHGKPWNPVRRSNAECELCYNGNCMTTDEATCEYYAEASKVLQNDNDQDDKGQDTGDKIDVMLFDLVESATSSSSYNACIPYISQYTDCTKENVCLGCKSCTCSEEGRWSCKVTQQCRPGPKLIIDHRLIGVVIDHLKRRAKQQIIRNKRSVSTAVGTRLKIVNGGTYNDIYKWLYGTETLNPDERTIVPAEMLEYVKTNETLYNRIESAAGTNYGLPIPSNDMAGIFPVSYTAPHNSINDIELLEFNDILESWTIESSTDKTAKVDADQTYKNHEYKELTKNDDDYTEYDPLRLVKREVSKSNKNQTQLHIEGNCTNNNFTYGEMLNDALYGLIRITSDKERELEELLSIQENIIQIAKAHNSSIDFNSTNSRSNYTKQHITIFNVDSFERCIRKLKRDMYMAIEDIIKTEMLRNSSSFFKDLKVVLHTIKKYVFPEQFKNDESNVDIFSSQEIQQNQRKYMSSDTNEQTFNAIKYFISIFTEINKEYTKSEADSLVKLSRHVRKVLKRVIKHFYLDDFAIIDLIVSETYYDFDNYLENIGTKWNKMMDDVINSEVPNKLHKMKLLHITLETDIGKIEDMISLLEFARYRRMSMVNGAMIEKAVSRIKENLKLIDKRVQKIIQVQKSQKMKRIRDLKMKKPAKKLSLIQKLKKLFQNSKNDIKNMLKKKFPKSEIIKRIMKNKVGQLQQQRMLEYRGAMNRRQEDLNIGWERKKRSAWGFKAIVDRIKSIIPSYLKGKVRKGMDSKKGKNNRSTTAHGRKKKKQAKRSTVKTTTLSR